MRKIIVLSAAAAIALPITPAKAGDPIWSYSNINYTSVKVVPTNKGTAATVKLDNSYHVTRVKLSVLGNGVFKAKVNPTLSPTSHKPLGVGGRAFTGQNNRGWMVKVSTTPRATMPATLSK